MVNNTGGMSNQRGKHNLLSKWCGDNWIAIKKKKDKIGFLPNNIQKNKFQILSLGH